jgi:hypothetical protein
MLVIMSMFLGGIGISFFFGWFLALVVMIYLPLLIFAFYKNIAVKGEVDDEEKTVYEQSDSRAQ